MLIIVIIDQMLLGKPRSKKTSEKKCKSRQMRFRDKTAYF